MEWMIKVRYNIIRCLLKDFLKHKITLEEYSREVERLQGEIIMISSSWKY